MRFFVLLLLSVSTPCLLCAQAPAPKADDVRVPPQIPADSAQALPQLPLRTITALAQFAGEDLHYAVRYGFIEAGKARLTVEPGPMYNQRPTWKVVGTGRSSRAFDWAFRVRDHYETHIDQAGLFPHLFLRRVREGGYRLTRDIEFDPARRTSATLQDGRVAHHQLPAFCQDVVSAFYYARNLPLERLAIGDLIEIPTLIDGEVHALRARLTGRDEVKVKLGTFDCWSFTPVVQEGRIWKDDSDLTVYVSADERRIPVLVTSDLLIGSIRLELTADIGQPSSDQFLSD